MSLFYSLTLPKLPFTTLCIRHAFFARWMFFAVRMSLFGKSKLKKKSKISKPLTCEIALHFHLACSPVSHTLISWYV